MPIHDVVAFVYKESLRDSISTRANSMAFSFFLALFPSIIFLFSLTPYIPFIEEWLPAMRNSIFEVMPRRAAKYMYDTINNIVSIPRGGLLSAGFLLALYFSTNGMMALLQGFQKKYESYKTRGFFHRRWVATKLTVLLGIMLLSSLVFVVMGEVIIESILVFFRLGQFDRVLLEVIRILTVFALIYFGIGFIYRYGPAFKKKMSVFSPGAMLATLLSIVSSLGFSFFVNNFGAYNEVYGAIGALIIFLVWLRINCFVILVGYEMNASIAIHRDLKTEIEIGSED